MASALSTLRVDGNGVPVPSGPPSPEEIADWNADLEGKDPDTIVRFAAQRFGARLAVATQFGVEGCTLIHRVGQLAPRSYVFTIDTGLLFEETLALAARLEERCRVQIHRVRPEQTLGEQAVRYAPNLWETDPDLCCTLRKVQPMQQTLERFDAWMTSVRREQTNNRASAKVVEWDGKFNLVKFAPYVALSAAEVQEYVVEHDVPTNPLRILGYPSLGCLPCTRPVQDGDDPRAGRWAGRSKTECGLHTRSR